jgi:rubrerythrin
MTKEIVSVAANHTVIRRRNFLRDVGFVVANLSVFAAASPAVAATQTGGDVDPDVNIMQGALAIEHEGIAAYRLAGASGLLTPGTLKVATLFLGHHQQHRDSLEALITKAGGSPVKAKSDTQYTQELDLGALKSEGQVVALAAKLEQGATNAYAGQVAALKNRQLTHLFTQLCADEAVHWTTLNNAMGVPIPVKAYLFG